MSDFEVAKIKRFFFILKGTLDIEVIEGLTEGDMFYGRGGSSTITRHSDEHFTIPLGDLFTDEEFAIAFCTGRAEYWLEESMRRAIRASEFLTKHSE